MLHFVMNQLSSLPLKEVIRYDKELKVCSSSLVQILDENVI